MKAGSTGGRGHEQPKTVVEFLPGPVKIKDGLFLGDELAARVHSPTISGHRVHHQQQSHPRHQHSLQADPQLVGEVRHPLSVSQLD